MPVLVEEELEQSVARYAGAVQYRGRQVIERMQPFVDDERKDGGQQQQTDGPWSHRPINDRHDGRQRREEQRDGEPRHHHQLDFAPGLDRHRIVMEGAVVSEGMASVQRAWPERPMHQETVHEVLDDVRYQKVRRYDPQLVARDLAGQPGSEGDRGQADGANGAVVPRDVEAGRKQSKPLDLGGVWVIVLLLVRQDFAVLTRP